MLSTAMGTDQWPLLGFSFPAQLAPRRPCPRPRSWARTCADARALRLRIPSPLDSGLVRNQLEVPHAAMTSFVTPPFRSFYTLWAHGTATNILTERVSWRGTVLRTGNSGATIFRSVTKTLPRPFAPPMMTRDDGGVRLVTIVTSQHHHRKKKKKKKPHAAHQSIC
jgi:hypothetical protein